MITSTLEQTGTWTPRQIDALTRAVLGRDGSFFAADWAAHEPAVRDLLSGSRILVLGGAGSIGAEVVRHLVRYQPARVVVVDVGENGLAELVRSIRSAVDFEFAGELICLPLDFGGRLGLAAISENGPYELALNFAALKHVRSEKDVFSLLAMLDTNVVKLHLLLETLARDGCPTVFSVSSDKAVRPASMMGASKRLMEQVLLSWQNAGIGRVCSARFANVAFSAGSLLDGFLHRLDRREPLAGPSDVRRYFISAKEAAQLCLLSAGTACSGELFVPRSSAGLEATGFGRIAEIILRHAGYEPAWYDSPADAKAAVCDDLPRGRYPCCFAPSDTAGEKPIEEFVGPGEPCDGSRFERIGVITQTPLPSAEQLHATIGQIQTWARNAEASPSKTRIVSAIQTVVARLNHVESDHGLDEKM
ncbi:MAG TPA: polysaccharide biosynthesis protein [Phycisphaerae bacterium]|nr:polysaccharide biosynthesis protein [Phycisphaerae bacterium]